MHFGIKVCIGIYGKKKGGNPMKNDNNGQTHQKIDFV